jgi:hypothetical protein
VARIGIAGHQRLLDDRPSEADAAWRWVRDSLRRLLGDVTPPLIGLTSLAAGADQVFGEVVLECGGTLEVVLPFAKYEALLSEPDRRRYDALHRHGTVEHLLEEDPIDDDARLAAFIEAGRRVVELSDRLLAVLEGREKSVTDTVVAYARELGRPVTILDARRREVFGDC